VLTSTTSYKLHADSSTTKISYYNCISEKDLLPVFSILLMQFKILVDIYDIWYKDALHD